MQLSWFRTAVAAILMASSFHAQPADLFTRVNLRDPLMGRSKWFFLPSPEFPLLPDLQDILTISVTLDQPIYGLEPGVCLESNEQIDLYSGIIFPDGKVYGMTVDDRGKITLAHGFQKIKSNVSVNRKQTEIIFFSSNQAAITYIFKAADPVGLYNFFFFVTCSPSMSDTNGRFVSMGSHMYFYKDLSAALK